MGKTGAFLQHDRRDPGYRPVQERLSDFRSVDRILSPEETREQASRCMDCGTPFCHAYGCGLGNPVPEINDMVFRGQWDQALKLLLSTNNFPEFTARLCPALCEAACVLEPGGAAATNRQIELSVIEHGFAAGAAGPFPPKTRTGRKVAVIGSGPSGLAAADTLNKAGCDVVVYERQANPGGILRYGIPDFKLEKWVVERRVRLMEQEGVTFETRVNVGSDISVSYLKMKFDALVIAIGAGIPRDLKIPGRELSGIHFAMEYLIQQNKRVSGEPLGDGREIHARGKKVVIIGGGDTGSDCLGTALRQRARDVTQLEIMPEPGAERCSTTPWPEWPLKLRKSHAHREGGRRAWSTTALSFEGAEGRVQKINCTKVRWERPAPDAPAVCTYEPGTETALDADLVLLAMGFTGPDAGGIAGPLPVELDARGLIKTDENNMTAVPGVFAAGDAARGQSLVVWAIGEGRKAAEGVLRYLGK
ncbi:MAG: glutamate synthase subunit beta [Thermodesulfobacteriota bacterium]